MSNIWSRRSLPPGPWGLPILGYLASLDPKNPHLTLTKLSKQYGGIYGLYLGGIYTIVLSDVKLVKKVLAMDATTGRAPLHLTHGVMRGFGLICAQGNLWKDQRKFVSTCLRQFGASKFGVRREELGAKIMLQVTNSITYLKEHGAKGVDPTDAFYHTVGTFMNELVFGLKYDRDDDTWQYIKFLQEEGIKNFGVAGPVNFLSFLRYVPKYKKVFDFIIDGMRRTHKIYHDIINDRVLNGAPKNILEAFLAERQRLGDAPESTQFYNDQQFAHLLGDVFGAGLHTTLTTICWYCLHMAANPEVQDKVHAELDAALQGREVTLDDQDLLPCTMASIAEVQRFNTVVPIGIPHGTLEELTVEGYRIPKGTMIMPLQWAIHTDPKYWDEPEKFKLEHFINEEGKFYRPEAFIPYQTGKRMCVGDELAKMLLFLFIANIMKEFRISADGDVNFQGLNSVTYCPLPQELIFTPRNQK
ncbi:cytochrome P450 306a1 isoform X2 [Atheta coriaria]